jgi:hypothetical protein
MPFRIGKSTIIDEMWLKMPPFGMIGASHERI